MGDYWHFSCVCLFVCLMFFLFVLFTLFCVVVVVIVVVFVLCFFVFLCYLLFLCVFLMTPLFYWTCISSYCKVYPTLYFFKQHKGWQPLLRFASIPNVRIIIPDWQYVEPYERVWNVKLELGTVRPDSRFHALILEEIRSLCGTYWKPILSFGVSYLRRTLTGFFWRQVKHTIQRWILSRRRLGGPWGHEYSMQGRLPPMAGQWKTAWLDMTEKSITKVRADRWEQIIVDRLHLQKGTASQ